ncbi:MAG: Clp1/GlmU family protein [Candidatus Baldrarchaeia archaeon]
MQVKVSKGKGLIVDGPARIEVLSGSGDLFGKPLQKDDVIIIRKAKSVGIQAETELCLEITGGVGFKVEEVDYPLISDEWKEIVEILKKSEKPVVVFVVGDVDTGKTTLVTYLGNILCREGFKVAILDEDVGQSDVGPPCTVGLGILTKPVAFLSDLEFVDGFFVGSTSPSGIIQRSIVGTKLMVEKAIKLGSDVILIDTCGWVFGREARELKTVLFYLLKPTHIILMEKHEGELDHLIVPLRNLRLSVMKVRSSARIRERNREERRFLREIMFRKYLENLRDVRVPLERVGVAYGILGSGKPVEQQLIDKVSVMLGVKVLHCEKCEDYLLIVTEDHRSIDPLSLEAVKRVLQVKDIKVVSMNLIKDVLVGLMDNEMNFLGVGIIKDYDTKSNELIIRTNVDEGRIAVIQYGSIKIGDETREEGKIRPWTF